MRRGVTDYDYRCRWECEIEADRSWQQGFAKAQ
jgi:hypothetical protein